MHTLLLVTTLLLAGGDVLELPEADSWRLPRQGGTRYHLKATAPEAPASSLKVGGLGLKYQIERERTEAPPLKFQVTGPFHEGLGLKFTVRY